MNSPVQTVNRPAGTSRSATGGHGSGRRAPSQNDNANAPTPHSSDRLKPMNGSISRWPWVSRSARRNMAGKSSPLISALPAPSSTAAHSIPP